MSIPSFDFDDFVKGVTTTIEQHLGDLVVDRGSLVAEEGAATPTNDLRPTTSDHFLLDVEKIVWHYPDTASRIIEESR